MPALNSLSGVRVLDAGGGGAAQLVSLWLASCGASVVRLDGLPANLSWPVSPLGFEPEGLLKASELASARSPEILADIDVFIVDRPVGELAGMGLLPEEVQRQNPRAHYCLVTGYGHEAGDRQWSELTVQAASGLMSTNGRPEDPPTQIGAPIALFTAALYALIGILASIHHQRRSGGSNGQLIDISAQECLVSLHDSWLTPVFLGAEAAPRSGNAHGYVAPWNAYPTLDGWVVIATISEAHWDAVCEVMDRADLRDDPSLRTPEARVRSPLVDSEIAAWTGRLRTSDVVERLSTVRIPVGAVQTTDAALTQIAASPRALNLPGLTSVLPARRAGEVVSVWLAGISEVSSSAHPAPSADDRIRAVTLPAPLRFAGALSGVVVIDAGHVHAVPVATRTLGELGATVIRIEPPAGDYIRNIRPLAGGTGYMFALFNTSKLSTSMELRSREGQQRLAELIRRGDMIFENFSGRAAAQLNLTATAVHAINPDIVHVSLKGFPPGSGLESRPAVDMVVQAMSGLMELTGYASGPPMKSGPPIVDRLSGIAASAASLAVFLDTAPTAPRELNVAMMDAAVTLCQLNQSGGLRQPQRIGNSDERDTPSDVYAALDGWVAVSVRTDAERSALATRTGCSEAELADALADVVRGLVVEEAVGLLRGTGAAAHAVLDGGQLLKDPDLERRGTFVELDAPEGKVSAVESPLRLSETPGHVRSFAPTLGQHDSELLRWIGMA